MINELKSKLKKERATYMLEKKSNAPITECL